MPDPLTLTVVLVGSAVKVTVTSVPGEVWVRGVAADVGDGGAQFVAGVLGEVPESFRARLTLGEGVFDVAEHVVEGGADLADLGTWVGVGQLYWHGDLAAGERQPGHLGHASAVITPRIYAHLWPGEEDRTRSVMDAVLGGLRTGCGPVGGATRENAGQTAQAQIRPSWSPRRSCRSPR